MKGIARLLSSKQGQTDAADLEACRQQLSKCQQELATCRAERDALMLQLQQARANSSSVHGTTVAAPTASAPGPEPSPQVTLSSTEATQHEHHQSHNQNNQNNQRSQGNRTNHLAGDVLVTDFLPSAEPIECSLQAITDVAEARDLDVAVWMFSAMQPGVPLQQHVQAHLEQGQCPGPHVESSARYFSSVKLKALGVTMQAVVKNSAAMWSNASTFVREWQALVKTLAAGNYDPVVSRGVIFGEPGKSHSTPKSFVNWPAIVTDSDGQRYWGMVRQVLDSSSDFQVVWGMRDLLTIKSTPSCVTVVAHETGAMLWQNAASMHTFGSHGLFNSSARLTHQGASQAHVVAASTAATQSMHSLTGCNFMQLLFGDAEQLRDLEACVQRGGTYRAQVAITDPNLRSWMGLREAEEATHDVQVSLTRDPLTLQKVYTVSQIDISATVAAQREVQAANARLAEEKLRMDALVQRQYNLITCLGRVSDIQRRDGSPNASSQELIDAVRRKLSSSLPPHVAAGRGPVGGVGGGGEDDLELLEVLGTGSFGKVYKAKWRGTVVAVKTMRLPSDMSGTEKRQRMALMEAAISSSLSHPNILQTFTYCLQPMNDTMSPQPSRSAPDSKEPTPGSSQQAGSAGVLPAVADVDQGGFEVRLVIEFCDMGTLRSALNRGMFAGNLRPVLATATDIACGMAHLHSLNIVHSDLKALNVLLRSNASDMRGLTAKIADFGLSVKMDAEETHLSKLFHGTPSHMAPEVLLHGKQSLASDVYAFGITLWELWTGALAFRAIPNALLGHRVVHEGLRPVFPADTFPAYADLARRCWAAEASDRPSFQEILKCLHEMAGPDQTRALPAAAQVQPACAAGDGEALTSGGHESQPLHAAGASVVGTAGRLATELLAGMVVTGTLTEDDC